MSFFTRCLFTACFVLLFYPATAQQRAAVDSLSAAARLAVMATGAFDHCSFGMPEWAAKKWYKVRTKNKSSILLRKRKMVIAIQCPENAGPPVPVFFWLVEKYESLLNKRWLVCRADIIWLTGS